MRAIDRLYYNMDKLIDGYKDTPEKRECLDRLEKELGEELYVKHEDTISEYTSASEKQGFVYGFQYAMSLMSEKR